MYKRRYKQSYSAQEQARKRKRFPKEIAPDRYPLPRVRGLGSTITLERSEPHYFIFLKTIRKQTRNRVKGGIIFFLNSLRIFTAARRRFSKHSRRSAFMEANLRWWTGILRALYKGLRYHLYMKKGEMLIKAHQRPAPLFSFHISHPIKRRFSLLTLAPYRLIGIHRSIKANVEEARLLQADSFYKFRKLQRQRPYHSKRAILFRFFANRDRPYSFVKPRMAIELERGILNCKSTRNSKPGMLVLPSMVRRGVEYDPDFYMRKVKRVLKQVSVLRRFQGARFIRRGLRRLQKVLTRFLRRRFINLRKRKLARRFFRLRGRGSVRVKRFWRWRNRGIVKTFKVNTPNLYTKGSLKTVRLLIQEYKRHRRRRRWWRYERFFFHFRKPPKWWWSGRRRRRFGRMRLFRRTNIHKKKMLTYNDYRRLRLYFGALKPKRFWKQSREVRKRAMGGSYPILHSYLDLRLDHLITKLNFATHIFEARRLIDAGMISVDERVTLTNSYTVKPFQIVAIALPFREEWRERYFINLIVQRTYNVGYKPLPPFIEPNWATFTFMVLPLFDRDGIYRPFRTRDFHVGGGKHQPEKVHRKVR